MIETREIPTAAFAIRSDQAPQFFFGEHKEDGKPRDRDRFSMLVSSGKTIEGHFFFGDLTIDLAGIQFKQRLPVLLDHDTSQRVGYTDSIKLTDEGIVAEGFFLKSSAAAKAVLEESRDGFPWQASVHLANAEIEELGKGDTAQVNGREVSGPATIFRQSRMREATFTAVGADDFTSGEALSQGDKVQVRVSTKRESMGNAKKLDTVEQEQAEAVDTEAIRTAALQEGRDAALKEERERASLIHKASTPSQTKLAHELVDSGASLAEAITKLHADPRRNASADLVELNASAPDALDPVKPAEGVSTEDDFSEVTMANAEAAWLAREDYRQNFHGNKEAFLARITNESRIGGINPDAANREGVFN